MPAEHQGAAQGAPRAQPGSKPRVSTEASSRPTLTLAVVHHPTEEDPHGCHHREVSGATAIRPFTVEFPEAEVEDLRARIAATRFLSGAVEDRSCIRWKTRRRRACELATMQALARYWATDYDLRRVEARLNALPQFVTEIDGLDIHFIHVKSRHEDALPVILIHGWPGSVVETLKRRRPLTDPTAHGGSASRTPSTW